MSAAGRLYTPELLALTLRLADFPWSKDLPLVGNARSKSCGSTLELGLDIDDTGRIATLGLKVHACAIGQAAAAIFAGAARARDREAIEQSCEAVLVWLNRSGQLPDWPGIEALEAARSYPARHGAIMLPWDAALAALSSGRAKG